jgi:hypothetical protein
MVLLLRATFLELRQHEVLGMRLPHTPVNEECKGLPCIPLGNQGEAVAEAVAEAEVVAVVAGTVRSGAGTVFSTVTVRADGTGGAACSRLLLIRPRRNPKSSATANTTSTNATNLASPGFLLSWMILLLPILLSLRSSSRTHTRTAGEVGPTAEYSHDLIERVRRHQRGSEEGRHPAPPAPPHPASGALGSDDHARQGPQ